MKTLDEPFIPRSQVKGSFSADHTPVLRVTPGTGQLITVETSDDSFIQMDQLRDVSKVTAIRNAVTGPIWVEGAEPGDVLSVTIHDIKTSDQGWSVYIPGAGALANRMGAEMFVRRIPLRDGRAQLTSRLSVPIQPMIGCIGVAPAEGEARNILPCYVTGGNMDIPDVAPGATLHLPVKAPGAFLALGDLHAAMAKGESSFIAIETAGRVTISLDLVKGVSLRSPRIDTGREVICVGLGNPVQSAITAAYEDLFDHLVTERGWGAEDAYVVMSAVADTELGGPVGSELPDSRHPMKPVGAVTLARMAKEVIEVHASLPGWSTANGNSGAQAKSTY